MTNSKLYYEAHVTLEPVYEDSPKAAVLRRIAVKFDFRVADLLMKKRSIDTPERSMFDSFLTTRHPDFDVVKARVFCAVTALKDEGFDVWRFKIEDTVMDSQLEDYPDMPKVSGKRREDKPFFIPPEQM
jgi:hypothetical protein